MNTDHCAYKKAEARRQRQEHVCNDMSMSRESAQHDADCKHMNNPASAQEQQEQQSWKHMPRFNKNHKCSDMTCKRKLMTPMQTRKCHKPKHWGEYRILAVVQASKHQQQGMQQKSETTKCERCRSGSRILPSEFRRDQQETPALCRIITLTARGKFYHH